MELDATFKTNPRVKGKGHNPTKERQLKERLCFNCNKPGHIAKLCKQLKKGNGGRKHSRQLNATWKGNSRELNATHAEWDEETVVDDTRSETTMVEESTEDIRGARMEAAWEAEEERVSYYYPPPPPLTGWTHS